MQEGGSFLAGYANILVFVGVAFLVSLFVLALSFVCAPRKKDEAKCSLYECGFDSFAPTRTKVHFRYTIAAILLVVFDVEFVLLVPWALHLRQIPREGFWVAIAFLLFLGLGFIYEWVKGALEWE